MCSKTFGLTTQPTAFPPFLAKEIYAASQFTYWVGGHMMDEREIDGGLLVERANAPSTIELFLSLLLLYSFSSLT